FSSRPPEAKASRTGPLIALESLHQPVWSPRDYASFAREGVMQNAIVFRAVRMVAEAAASVPLLLYEGDMEIEAHPLLDLIARPNPVATAPDLLEAWYGYLLVSGNAYLEAVATGGEIRELYALRPDRMKVVPGSDGWPEAYDYSTTGESVRFAGEVVPGVRPILHVKLFHPANDHYGLSPLEAAATAIDIHNTASRWNKALLDNSARPSGALVYTARDGNLSPEQYERLKSELEAGFQGAAHAGRPLLLEGGLDWKSMSLTPKDMDFIEAKHVAAREIALALGVPPMLLGIPGDNTYSNLQEATRSFWRQTVLPLVDRTAKALSAWLGPAWSERLELRADLDRVEALSPEREALWARLEKASFLTPNEKRAAIGYAPLDEAGSDALRATAPREPKFNPHHDDLGRFTFKPEGDAGNDTEGNDSGIGEVQARPRTPVTIRGRTYLATPAEETELRLAANRAEAALARVRKLDPEWKPAPFLSDPQSARGAITGYTSLAQQAEARALVVERGGVPMGFETREQFVEFGRRAWDTLTESGHRDAEPYLRGSSVTGYSYRTGEAFDAGRRSDLDLAIASPTLIERAEALGVVTRGQGTRTMQLDKDVVEALGLRPLQLRLEADAGRPVPIMIYRSRGDIEARGPSIRLP
ncbi:MAG: phage portal protein, partial [Hyphomicrobiales bacterium]